MRKGSRGFKGENVVTVKVSDDTQSTTYTIVVTMPMVVSLELGDCVFVPTFHPDTLEYVTTSLEAADILSLVVPSECVRRGENLTDVVDYRI